MFDILQSERAQTFLKPHRLPFLPFAAVLGRQGGKGRQTGLKLQRAFRTTGVNGRGQLGLALRTWLRDDAREA